MPNDPACMTRRRPATRQWTRLCTGVALATGLCLALGAAHAQSGSRYQVELVIFTQPAGTSLEQRPLPAAPLPADDIPGQDDDAAAPVAVDDIPGLYGDAAPPVTAAPATADPAPGAESPGPESLLPPGVSMPEAPLALAGVATRLNRGEYRLLWHQAWVQPAAAVDGLDLATLAALGRGPADPAISGTIHLSAGRFLHLGVDLQLDADAGVAAQMRQQRRIRPGIDQYFDHPHIGVIAIVSRLEEGPQAGTGDAQSEL